MSAHKTYFISVETASRPLQAVHNGAVLADSAKALVMHETGLPSYHYFPPNDVKEGLLQPSQRRTFCPFKGTASYWHLDLPDGRIENAAFSYETPFNQVREVAGYIAFLDTSLDQPLSLEATRMDYSGPLVDWLLRDAWMCQTAGELTENFSQAVLASGIPLWRFSVGIWTLHPQLAGRGYIWERDDDGVRGFDTPHGMLSQPDYLNISRIVTPAQLLDLVRQRSRLNHRK